MPTYQPREQPGGNHYRPLAVLLAAAVTAGCGDYRDPHPTEGIFVWNRVTAKKAEELLASGRMNHCVVDFSDRDGVERAVVEDADGNVVHEFGLGGRVDSVPLPDATARYRLRVYDDLGNQAVFEPGRDTRGKADAYIRMIRHGKGRR